MSGMESNDAQEKERVRLLLRRAFCYDDPNDPNRLTHEDCLYWRGNLPLLRDEDLPSILAHVMEDLLDTHSGRVGEREDADFVVQHLDVYVRENDLDFVRELCGEEGVKRAVEEARFLRESLSKSFASFTQEQACAILEWLKLARTWKDLEWNLENIDSAIAYWEERAAGGGK